MQTHVCANFSRICTNILLLNAKVVKIALISRFWQNLTSLNLTCFYGPFSACLSAKFYFENAVCAKEFAFRRSALHYATLHRTKMHCSALQACTYWGILVGLVQSAMLGQHFF